MQKRLVKTFAGNAHVHFAVEKQAAYIQTFWGKTKQKCHNQYHVTISDLFKTCVTKVPIDGIKIA